MYQQYELESKALCRLRSLATAIKIFIEKRHRHLTTDARQPTDTRQGDTRTLNDNDEQQTITSTTFQTEQSATSNCTYSLCNISTRTRQRHKDTYLFLMIIRLYRSRI
jgi:hypothetical protein